MHPAVKIMKTFLKKKSSGLKCFDEERRKEDVSSRVDLGIRPVKIDRVVGSVARPLDFDPKFESRGKDGAETRYNSVKGALEKGLILPAVDLYKIKDEYYVVDGHHRVSAAKEIGQKYVDAHVTEFLPPKDSPENALYLRRFDFEQKLGIEGIYLSRPSGYDRLVWQIDLHQQYLANKTKSEVSRKDAGRDWFYSIHRPVIQKIEEEKLTRQLDGATAGDIYVYLTEDLQLRNKRNGHCLDLAEALKETDLLAQEAHITKGGPTLRDRAVKILLRCRYWRKRRYH